MSAYDVMDSLLRTSLTLDESEIVTEDDSISPFEVELALLGEGDAALYALWCAVNGESVIFEHGLAPSWLVEADEDPEGATPVRRLEKGDVIYDAGKRRTVTQKSIDAALERGAKGLVGRAAGRWTGGGGSEASRLGHKSKGKVRPVDTGRLPSSAPLPSDASVTRGVPNANAALHTTMHVIAGIKDPHDLKPHERNAIGRLVQVHGHDMGYSTGALGKTGSAKELSAHERALHTFMGTYPAKGDDSDDGESSADAEVKEPFKGIRDTAKEYVKRKENADARSAPNDVHDQVKKLIRKKAREYRGYHTHQERDRRLSMGGKGVKSLTKVTAGGDEKEHEGKAHVSVALGSRDRSTRKISRAARIDKVHDMLGGGTTPEHAARLRAHFDYHDAKDRIAHHEDHIQRIKKDLLGAHGASKEALLKELRHHEKNKRSEENRYNRAAKPRNQIQAMIDKQTAALARVRAREKETGQDFGSHLVQKRLDLMYRAQKAIHHPEGAKNYKVAVHKGNFATGGHEEYGFTDDQVDEGRRRALKLQRDAERRKEKKAAAKAEGQAESISLFDVVFEADEGEGEKAGDEGEPGKKKKKDIFEPSGGIGGTGMPEGWAGAIAKHLGMKPEEVTRATQAFFGGEHGTKVVRNLIRTAGPLKPISRIPSSPTRAASVQKAIVARDPEKVDAPKRSPLGMTPRVKKLFVQAAAQGRFPGAKGEKSALGPAAERERLVQKHHRKWTAAPATGVKPPMREVSRRAPASSSITLTPEQQKKRAERVAAAEKKAGEEHAEFTTLTGRKTPEEVAAAKVRGQMTPAEKQKRVADAKARREARALDAEAKEQAKREAAGAAEERKRSSMPGALEDNPEDEKDKEDEDEDEKPKKKAKKPADQGDEEDEDTADEEDTGDEEDVPSDDEQAVLLKARIGALGKKLASAPEDQKLAIAARLSAAKKELAALRAKPKKTKKNESISLFGAIFGESHSLFDVVFA